MAKPTQSLTGASDPLGRDPLGHADAVDEYWDERQSDAVAAGAVLGGKYRLISEIGRGGMGSVWRAQHLGWEAPVALKIMNREITARPEAVARFEREVRLAAGLRSPHVVQVLDHGVDQATRTPFIAMELLEGESLARRLKRIGRLSPAEMFQVFSQLVRALTRAHSAGIVHRDLKPDNVFLVRNEEEILTKVLDFGVAKWTAPDISESGLTRPGSVVGTPYYMSPEQIQGSREIDHRADLWALAAIACECLTGRRPFEAPDFAQLAVLLVGNTGRPLPSSLGSVPPRFDAWFLRATDPDISRRFQSAREMALSLAAVCDAAPSGLGSDAFPSPRELTSTRAELSSVAPISNTASRAVPSGLFEPRGLWQRPMLKLVVSTVLTTLLVTGGLAFWFSQRPRATAGQKQVKTAAPPAPVDKAPVGPIVRPIHPLDPPSQPAPLAGGDALERAGSPEIVSPQAVSPPPAVNDGFDPIAAQKSVRAAQLARLQHPSKGKKARAQGSSKPPAAPNAPAPRATNPAPSPSADPAPDKSPSLVDGRRIRTSL